MTSAELGEFEVLRRRARRRRFMKRALKRLVIWSVIILTLAPGYWIIIASLSKGNAFFTSSLGPGGLTLDNYRSVLSDSEFVDWVKNSIIVCTAVAGVSTIATALAAYAFSRLRFYGRRYGLMGLLIIQMFPVGVAIPAYFYVLFRLGNWTDGKVGLDTQILIERQGRHDGQMIGKSPWLQSVHAETVAAPGDMVDVTLVAAGPNSMAGEVRAAHASRAAA